MSAEVGYIQFCIPGKPWVQKNNLHIQKRKTPKGLQPFIGHSKEMASAREHMAVQLYQQYRKQGYVMPIDYLIEAHLVFYVERWHEPDLDNLPAIVWDAMQGVKVKGFKVGAVLANDKLLRREVTEKIVEGDEDYDGKPRTEIRIRRYQRSDSLNRANGAPLSSHPDA